MLRKSLFVILACLFALNLNAEEISKCSFDNEKALESAFLYCNENAAAGKSFDPAQRGVSGKGALKITINRKGKHQADVQLFFPALCRIASNHKYRISFDIKTNSAQKFDAYCSINSAPWTKISKTSFRVETQANKWKSFEFEFTALADVHESIRAPLFLLGKLPVGTALWIDNVRLLGPDNIPPKLLTIGRVAPISGFKKLRNWDIDKAWRKTDGNRMKISLNQMWLFSPVKDSGVAVPADDSQWGYFMVPGHWRGGNINNFMRTADGKQIELWKGKKIYNNDYQSAWYKRTFAASTDWKGKAVYLEIEKLSTAGEIYVNGEKVLSPEDIGMGGGVRVRIDEQLQYGKKNEVLIRVDSPGPRNKVKGGIMSDVFLEVMSKSNFGEPVIKTFLEKEALSLRFVGGTAGLKGTLSVSVRDAEDGAITFSEKVPYADHVEIKCKPKKLWSPNKPNLCFVDLKLIDSNGRELDSCSRRFGFREFKVRGSEFLLNGKPLTLKLDTGFAAASVWALDWHMNREAFRRNIRAMKLLGLNSMYFSSEALGSLASVADEEGLLLLMKPGIFTTRDIRQCKPEDEGEMYEKLDRVLSTEVDNPLYFNHPSQIGFLIDVWANYNSGATNPAFVGMKQGQDSYATFTEDGEVTTTRMGDPNLSGIKLRRKYVLEKMSGVYKKYFPEMETFTGASAEVDNVYATHIYHTWGAPMAELRALFSRWSMQKDLPIFIGETTIPYQGSFYVINKFSAAGSDPLFKENSARVDGNDAYVFEGVYGRRPLHDYGKESLQGSTYEPDPENGGGYYFYSDLYMSALTKYINDLIPAWRLSGVKGLGMFCYAAAQHFCYAGRAYDLNASKIPDDLSLPGFKPAQLRRAASFAAFDAFGENADYRPLTAAIPFKKAMSDLTCHFFSGGKDVYQQDHAFFSGEVVSKKLVVMNDTERKYKFVVQLDLKNAAGAILESKSMNVVVLPFEHKMTPVEFSLPSVNSREELRIVAKLVPLEQSEESTILKTSFNVEVFPHVARRVKTRSALVVCDPEKKLSAWLNEMGYSFNEINSLADAPEQGVLLVGRRALSLTDTVPDFNRLAAGGLNVLIMEQGSSACGEFMRTRTRTAFINAEGHSALSGFKDKDFSNWRGGHSLLPAYQKGKVGVNWADWGNRGMLASYVFRRPAHGNYQSLLVSGFDLHQAPLLEYRSSRGSWIGSQLEITDRLGVDPVATTLLARLINYLDLRGSLNADTAFFGGEKGEAFLQKIKVQCKAVDGLDVNSLNNVNTLIVADPDWKQLVKYRFAVNRFVYEGGNIVYLHQGGRFSSSWLPFAMGMKEVEARHALHGNDNPDCLWRCGWDNNDLYWHDKFKVQAFTDFPPQFEAVSPAVLVRRKYGDGNFVFCSITPECFGDSPATGKTSRMLCALLSSAGVSIENEAKAYAMKNGQVDRTVDLSGYSWEFALDPENVGLKENWQTGADGSATWMRGLIADGAEVGVGQTFESFLRKEYDGYVWYRLEVDVSQKMLESDDVYFCAGAIDDFDEVYVNGVKVGATGRETPQYWMAPRLYRINKGVLKFGKNLIAVRVFDVHGGGGIVRLPLALANRPICEGGRVWQTPYPKGSDRDYKYKSDMIRMY